MTELATTGTATRHALWRWSGVSAAIVLLASIPVLVLIDPSTNSQVLAFVGYIVMGGLLLWQLPGNRVGWTLLATGAGFSAGALLDSSIAAHLPTALEAIAQPLRLMGFFALIVLVTIFPDGRAPGLGQRIILWGVALLAVGAALSQITYDGILDSGRANPLAVPAMQDLDSWLYGHGFISIPALLLAGLFNMVWRWRRSAGIERQQYRWLVSACTVMVTAMLLLVTNDFAGWSVALMLVALNALPVAVATAVTRYRLFDLERLISRTASYAVVTGLLVATYAVVVTAATQLLPRNSPLAVTVATLTAAALARPLYRRFQAFVDHRFNRTKFDAHRTVDAFGLRLRRQFDFEAVRVDLVEVVRESLEPHEVRLWVRPR
ncbi:MAG: hypothetical protein ACJ72Y_08605 [Actinomycetes bacterium]